MLTEFVIIVNTDQLDAVENSYKGGVRNGDKLSGNRRKTALHVGQHARNACHIRRAQRHSKRQTQGKLLRQQEGR